MPYNNPYNQAIARDIAYINKKYIAHSDATGQGTVDYTQSVNLTGGFFPVNVNILDRLNHKKGGGNAIVGGASGVAEFKGGNSSKLVDENQYEPDSDEDHDSIKGGGKNDYEMKGGAILGLQQRRPVEKTSVQVPNVAKSFGTLGAPEGVSKTRDMVALSSMPSANAKVGIASKPVESKIEGGNGFASGTHNDTGFDATKGAIGKGKSEGSGIISTLAGLFGLGKVEGKKILFDKKILGQIKEKMSDKKLEGSGIISTLSGLLGLGKEEGDNVVFEKKDVKKLLDKFKKPTQHIGLLPILQKAPKSKLVEEARKFYSHRTKEVRPTDNMSDEEIVKHYKKEKKIGGGTSLKSTPKKEQTEPVPKAQMPSSTLAGMGKEGTKNEGEGKPKKKRVISDKIKRRNLVVKKIKEEKGLSLIEASKYVKEHNIEY